MDDSPKPFMKRLIPASMIAGEKFLKWTEHDTNTAQPVLLHVDSNGFFLYWKDLTRDKDTSWLDVSLIRDVRRGPQARVPKDAKLRESLSTPHGSLEERTLTIVHGSDLVNINFLNFVSPAICVAKDWYNELLHVTSTGYSANFSSLKSLQKIHTHIRLAPNSDGKIPIKSILKLFAQNKEDRKVVERALELSDLPSRKDQAIEPDDFDFKAFFSFYQHLSHRKEVQDIFVKFCKEDPRSRLMARSEFIQFVNEQRDPRLNEILFPYCTQAKAQVLIQDNEPNPINVEARKLSLEGFLRYLLSDENQIVGSEYLDLYSSMNEPLSHYFIQSSHNTYLTGHQWTGRSSVEIYRQVLLSGCRCIELDLWDGTTKEEEPVIKHGYTLVPEIYAKDVILAIAEFAFKTSEFPVILSFENHCKPRQQIKVARYCREFFGEMLLSDPLENYPLEAGSRLPSPNDLKRKIIIKNKKRHVRPKTIIPPKEEPSPSTANISSSPPPTMSAAAPVPTAPSTTPSVSPLEDKPGGSGGGGQDSESEDEDMEVSSAEVPVDEVVTPTSAPSSATTAAAAVHGRETKVSEELSRLVNYAQAVRFHGFGHAEKRDLSFEMSSFEETNALGLLKEHPLEFVNYNKRQLSRIFPRGTRMDSSNFMPQVFWNAGCQFVALNFQTLDLAMQLNLGMFEYNARSGYLPKPSFMCRSDRIFDPFADAPVDGIVPATVSIQVLSGQFLTDRHVGTYVEVDMYGLPCDTVRRKFRTKVVPNNGICPVFNDEPFLFKQVVLPDLAVIRIAVYEESGRFIGHRVLPISGLRPGYRHITLRNEAGNTLYFPSLFCHVKVQDFVPDRLSDFADALANPIRYQSILDKRTEQLLVLTAEEKMIMETPVPAPKVKKKYSLRPRKHVNSTCGDFEEHPLRYSSSIRAVPSRSRQIEESSLLSRSTISISGATSSSISNILPFTSGSAEASKRWTTSFDDGRSSSVHSSPGLSPKSPHPSPFSPTSNNIIHSSSCINNNNNYNSSSNLQLSKSGIPPTAYSKNLYLNPESIETFLSHKSILDKRTELDKRLKALYKKYEKEFDRARSTYKAKEEKYSKKAASTEKNSSSSSKNKLVKILSEKALDVSRVGNDSGSETSDKLAKTRKQFEDKTSSITKEKEKAENELKEKFFDSIWYCAEKLMKSSQSSQIKALDVHQERDIEDMMKSIEIQANEEIKEPKDGNKEEALRVKRERRSFIIKRGVEERKRLDQFYFVRKEALEEQHRQIRKDFLVWKEKERSSGLNCSSSESSIPSSTASHPGTSSPLASSTRIKS